MIFPPRGIGCKGFSHGFGDTVLGGIGAFHAAGDLLLFTKQMAKKKEEKKQEAPKGRGGCIKRLVMLVLLVVFAYFGMHIYFLWQPVGKPGAFGHAVIDAKIAGVKVFPAIEVYPMNHIAGREEILNGRSIPAPLLKERLNNAVRRNYPVTFREEEVNAWLNKRLEVKQGGVLAPFVKARGVWVDFKQDEIEIIIEREFGKGRVHVTSLFMKFNRSKQGYSIERHSSHIGQVRAPGGFARLIMPAFEKLAEELTDELKFYQGGKIKDIKVGNGKITLDPRRPDQRL